MSWPRAGSPSSTPAGIRRRRTCAPVTASQAPLTPPPCRTTSPATLENWPGPGRPTGKLTIATAPPGRHTERRRRHRRPDPDFRTSCRIPRALITLPGTLQRSIPVQKLDAVTVLTARLLPAPHLQAPQLVIATERSIVPRCPSPCSSMPVSRTPATQGPHDRHPASRPSVREVYGRNLQRLPSLAWLDAVLPVPPPFS